MRQTALRTVFQLAKDNPRIVFVGSDLGAGTLQEMNQLLPNQFFMEGISEQHLLGFAAGLAKEGYIPYLNTIANFLSRRALEQIIVDIALHNLPVKLLGSGGGMVYAPLGPTHTAVDDLAHMLAIPNLKVFSPCDASEMREVIVATTKDASPAYIRFGKGGETEVSTRLASLDGGCIKYLGDFSSEHVLITTGVVLQPALEAVDKFLKEINPLVIHIPCLNISENPTLEMALRGKSRVLVIEEHLERGGLLTQILHYSLKRKIPTEALQSISLGTEYIRRYGSQQDHFVHFRITPENIANCLLGDSNV